MLKNFFSIVSKNGINHIFLILALFGSAQLSAQHSFDYDNSIPVVRISDTLENPWAGGLNFIQISEFDYNQNGMMDLLVFDRSSDQIKVYTQETGPNGLFYQHQFGASELFPPDLRYRAQLFDYDNDGRNDLFTWGIGGLKVYRNVSNGVNGLQWIVFKDIVYSDYAVTGINPLFISADDIPALVDVDYDGDLDILTSDAQGLRIEYHQNQSMETYGIPDSLLFVQKNECWGKFTEGLNSSVVTLFDPNPPCVGGNIPNPEKNATLSEYKLIAHQGTSILALDIDSSGVRDLILGDAAYNGLTLLLNGGTAVNTDSPMISFDDAFPSYTTPVKCNNFPASFYVDVDFDGLNDLIVSPNSENSSFDKNSVLFYKNLASNGQPTFSPVSTNFLQSSMIEHGTGSIPVLFDYNEDGLKDLIVANYYNYKATNQKESLIALYLNTGTSTAPVFKFIDDDILNLVNANLGLRSVPAFGDIDNDGDEDLFLGLEDGTLIFYENTSTGNGAIWALGTPNYQDNQANTISVNAFSYPQLFDLNNDGLLDLLLGNRLGNIIYYQNVGSATIPSFELMNSTLGQVDILPGNQSSNASIHFFRENNEIHLLCGSFKGTLSYYTDIATNLAQGASFNLVSDNYQGIDVGKHSSIYLDDIDDDGILNAFLGQDLGGIFHYNLNEGSIGLTEQSQTQLAIYPNPAIEFVTISADELINSIEVVDMRGRIQFSENNINKMGLTVPVIDLDAGIYILLVELTSGQLVSKKLIVR
ncbi:MAG: hypothetical protein ACJA0U_000151 [Salibacteraceae bacterium]|jgi:hypothetical protein